MTQSQGALGTPKGLSLQTHAVSCVPPSPVRTLLSPLPRGAGRLLPCVSPPHPLPASEEDLSSSVSQTPSSSPRPFLMISILPRGRQPPSIQKAGKEGELPTTDGPGHGDPTWVLAKALLSKSSGIACGYASCVSVSPSVVYWLRCSNFIRLGTPAKQGAQYLEHRTHDTPRS